MMDKSCRACSQKLPISEFSRDNRKYGDGYRSHCKKCRKSAANAYRAANGYSNAAAAKRWRENPASMAREKAKARREARPENEFLRNRIWREKNAPKLNAKRMAYEARKMSATPSWANQKYINLWYEIAKHEERRTGRKCHVDHIVPLKSPIVCGLHCEFNLQVLFAEDTAAKSNRYWPDAP